MPRLRLLLALTGALAGGSLYLLFRFGLEGILGGRVVLAAMVFCGVFFSGLLALAGPIAYPRAAGRAAVLALVVALLALWASFRFDEVQGILTSPGAVVSVLILSLVPLPFILAEDSTSWRDYPALFAAAWGVVMRSTVAWVFVAILWAVIYLCHALLSLVGIDVIARVLEVPPTAWLITGTGLGLAMAVALELAEFVSAYLVLRLLRLLLPVVLPVVVIFLIAVGVKGPGTVLAGFSIGAILLLISGVSATLVTAAVDQSDAEATHNRWMIRATQGLAVLLILPAGMAAWSVGTRVAAHGWTPDRLFAATVAALGLGYGATYLVAVLRGAGWMERVRQANIWMALALMGAAVLWLTPVLDPERISTASQLARLNAGAVTPAEFDWAALDSWGRAGAAARARLQEQAKSDPELAGALPSPGQGAGETPVDAAALRLALIRDLTVQPASAGPFRDQVIGLAADADLQAWRQSCAIELPQGVPGCVMVAGDFLPELPGPEGLLIMAEPGGYLTYMGVAIQDGALRLLQVDSASGELANFGEGERLIATLRAGLPTFRPVPRNELVAPIGGALGLKP